MEFDLNCGLVQGGLSNCYKLSSSRTFVSIPPKPECFKHGYKKSNKIIRQYVIKPSEKQSQLYMMNVLKRRNFIF